jgi:hypothetical protein
MFEIWDYPCKILVLTGSLVLLPRISKVFRGKFTCIWDLKLKNVIGKFDVRELLHVQNIIRCSIPKRRVFFDYVIFF